MVTPNELFQEVADQYAKTNISAFVMYTGILVSDRLFEGMRQLSVENEEELLELMGIATDSKEFKTRQLSDEFVALFRTILQETAQKNHDSLSAHPIQQE